MEVQFKKKKKTEDKFTSFRHMQQGHGMYVKEYDVSWSERWALKIQQNLLYYHMDSYKE